MAPLRVPPNPFDRWARSESGLHLPSRLVPRAAKRLHHIEKFGQAQCCCEGWEPPPPTCLCMGVAISGLAAGTCSDYGQLVGHSHALPFLQENVWQCVLSEQCGLCDDMTLTLSYDAETGVWTFTVGGVVWQGEGDPCDTITLSYVSDDGYLDGSGSSVSITPVNDAQCGCWCSADCEHPCGGKISPFVAVSIQTLQNGDSETCTFANGTWVIPWRACGQGGLGCWCPQGAPAGLGNYWSRWSGAFTDFDFYGDHPVCDWIDFRIEFVLYYDSTNSKWYIKLDLTPNTQTTGCWGCGFGVYFSKEVTEDIGTGVDDGDCVNVQWGFDAADACLLAGGSVCDIGSVQAWVGTL